MAASAAGKPIPIDAFVEEQKFSQPRLSPDGKHIAVNVRVRRRDERTIPTMTIYSLPDMKIVNTIGLPGYEILTNFRWISNRRLIVNKGLEVGNRERPVATGEVLAVDLDGAKPQYLYGYKGFQQSSRGNVYGDDRGTGVVAHIPRTHNNHVFLGTHEWDGNRSLLYDINSITSHRKLLADIAMKDMGFLVQHDDKPRFSYGTDEENTPILFRLDEASGEWRRVDADTLGAGFYPFAFTPDDKAVYARHSANGGPYAVVREDMQTGKRTLIAEDPLGSIEEMEFSAAPEMPFAVATGVGIPKARYLDETAPDAVLHKTLSGLFPDAYVSFINFTDDGQKLLFTIRSDRDPGSYYLFDRATSRATHLLSNMQQIQPEQMAERRPIRFAARDGLALTGYLTLPANPDKKKLPMVLLPHGGPFDVRDEWFFDDDAQFLASRGYAVLQVNFRGSGGRGRNFKQAGFREYGGKIMNDLADGVRWANGLPDIDASRVCVFGASFGGYAALMLPVREPDLFKCSVGYAGRYDLASRYKQEGIAGDKQATNFLIRTMGQDPAMLAAASPTRLADQINVPVLLVHGDKDETTPLDQAEMMRDALIKAGRPPEWMLVKHEGHGFYAGVHRKEFYQRLEAFLAKHLGQ